MSVDDRRARLALPFTIVRAPGVLRLVAGEAFRYTLRGDTIERWGPPLLDAFEDGARVGDALAAVEPTHRDAARALVLDLYGERVLVDASGTLTVAAPPRLAPRGAAALVERLESSGEGTEGTLPVLCQDTLDYAAAGAFGRARRAAGEPWLWVSTAPLARAYVGPVLLPDAGPCITCIERHFRRLSPAPELFDALRDGDLGPAGLRPTPFPDAALDLVAALVRWKAASLAAAEQPRGLYDLHVVEVATFEVTAHRPMLDPTCPDCAPW